VEILPEINCVVISSVQSDRQRKIYFIKFRIWVFSWPHSDTMCVMMMNFM